MYGGIAVRDKRPHLWLQSESHAGSRVIGQKAECGLGHLSYVAEDEFHFHGVEMSRKTEKRNRNSCLRLFEMNKTALDGVNGGLRAVPCSEFVQHAAYMDAHGLFGNLKGRGNLPVAVAMRDQRKDLLFPGRKLRKRDSFRKCVTHSAGQIANALIDRLNRADQFLATRVFGQIGHRSVAQSAIDIFATVVIRQYNYLRGAVLPSNCGDRVKSVQPG